MIRLLGLDPGTRRLGWGFIDVDGSRLIHVAHGTIVTRPKDAMCDRLAAISEQLDEVLLRHSPKEAAVEQVFTAVNIRSALLLGQARGVVLASLGRCKMPVAEYAPAEVKLAVAGHGRASKEQLASMASRLLSVDLADAGADASDALAIAICHAHGRRRARLAERARQGGAR